VVMCLFDFFECRLKWHSGMLMIMGGRYVGVVVLRMGMEVKVKGWYEGCQTCGLGPC